MELKFGDKTININKWKGRNKKEFIKEINRPDPDEDETKMMDILVYSCVDEKDVVLETEEFRYVLSKIRSYSLGDDIEFEYFCPECKKYGKTNLKLSDIIRYTYTPMPEINVGDVSLKLGKIKNRELFKKKFTDDEDYEFLFKIEAFNGDDTFTLEELIQKFDALDVEVLEKIMSIYNKNKFRVDDVNEITCDCGHKMLFEFDEIPGFFPDSWFKFE